MSHEPPLTAEAAAFLAASSGLAPWPTLTPEQARAQNVASRKPDAGAPNVAVRDVAAPRPDGTKLALRIYGDVADAPVLVFFHGGGWVYGDLDMADGFCRRLCVGAAVTVCSVDYRLAPEHPFPEPLDDAVLAGAWASSELAHGGPIGVIGSSAGGNLAAASCLAARRDGGPPIAMQVLLCPVTDHRFDTASYVAHGVGRFLEADDMRWYWQQYLAGGRGADDPLASVLRADLAGLPPAVVVTASHDVLRDEGEAFAARLREAGVPVVQERFDGLVHAFAVLAAFPAAQARVIALVAQAVARWLPQR